MTHVDPLPILVKNFVFEKDKHGKLIHGEAIPIKKFIEHVKEVEEKEKVKDEHTTRMITRMRKVFYGDPLWDMFVIADKDAWVCSLNPIQDDKIKSAKIVKLRDGYYLDIGHVFAGLDALQHPKDLGLDLFPNHLTRQISSELVLPILRNSTLFETHIDNNAHFSTWLGDLGDLLKEKLLTHKGDLQKAITDTKRPAAPGEDMLGNIDAYVIYDIYFDKNSKMLPKPSKPMKLSEILEDYYIKRGFEDGQKKDRYHTFAKRVDLMDWDPESQTFSNEVSWIEYFVGQLRCAATLCIVRFSDDDPTKKIKGFVKNVVEEDGKVELKAFLAGLKELM
ncbi:MAG: hypothetical protein KJ077_36825 [Anaerolineae bacterium]|nr:hypothetical protein [Anaerolineae bacterium]